MSPLFRPLSATDDPARDLLRRLDIEPREAPAVLWRVVRLAFRYRRRFAIAAITSLGAAFFNLLTPGLLGRAVDQTHHLLVSPDAGGGALGALGWTGALVLGASVLRGALQMASGYASEHLGQSVGRDLRVGFFEKLQRLGFDYHDRVHSGDLITRGMLDLEGVRGFIENGLQRLISLVLLLSVGSAILFAEDPLMAALTLSFVPFVAWRAANMGLRLRVAWTRLQERLAVLTRVMEENLQAARLVRAFASAQFEMAKFDVTGREALALANQRIVTRSRSMATIHSSYYLAMALLLWVGGQRVQAGVISIGQLTQFLAFMTILQLPVRQIGMIVNSSARAISSGKRVFEILDLEPAIRDAPDAQPLVKGPGILRFDNVCFSYAGGDGAPPALHDISFTVGPGQTLGIVGPSGSGKSTIAQLIPRFYDVTGGRITLDGQDVRSLQLASLRKAVGLVQQDIFLFDDSLARNIAYAAPETEESDLLDAAAAAQIHDFITALPGGYASPAGERGSSLSGGQRQRIAIARGLVPQPAVLIFDDVTSAIDAGTVQQLRAALQTVTDDRATIIIAHHLGSVIHADEIIVLEKGYIAERGTHAALLAARGYYARLFALQKSGAVDAREDVADRRQEVA
ncbi:ATP-binding cassette subfamily B protein [Sphingopyxis panaciterrae]|uniref:ABC transporter ATP-binding protein n=1 Tax=Sphingopyxis panaciterrae TaxID=363841 RepID=UPI00142123B4|nr:ABC transporter ATP-binding protein [Sphingopyxis panaciterrae]NIJ37361.1 ATP-binding cassette subfamily B protein [Sphingopyxis panaciterrae]